MAKIGDMATAMATAPLTTDVKRAISTEQDSKADRLAMPTPTFRVVANPKAYEDMYTTEMSPYGR